MGDIRNKQRLKRALINIDLVIHAAALKQVPAGEYDPFEFIHTNVIGGEKSIEACFDAKLKKHCFKYRQSSFSC